MTTNDIDWHRVHTARVSACCTRAAREFGVPVETPFTLHDAETGTAQFIAHFPSLGGGNGMLVCLRSDWDRVGVVAQQHGYSCAGLDPEHYSAYDPARWRSIFDNWAHP